MGKPTKKALKELRKKFMSGIRIQINNDYATVIKVDDDGNVIIEWDNGRLENLMYDKTDYKFVYYWE